MLQLLIGVKDNTYYFSFVFCWPGLWFRIKNTLKDLTDLQKNVLLLGSDKPILIQADSRFKTSSGFERPLKGFCRY